MMEGRCPPPLCTQSCQGVHCIVRQDSATNDSQTLLTYSTKPVHSLTHSLLHMLPYIYIDIDLSPPSLPKHPNKSKIDKNIGQDQKEKGYPRIGQISPTLGHFIQQFLREISRNRLDHGYPFCRYPFGPCREQSEIVFFLESKTVGGKHGSTWQLWRFPVFYRFSGPVNGINLIKTQ